MRDPLLYDVQINTGRTTIDEAASLIERLVRGESELAGSTAQINQRGAGAIA
jgi:hypothetical protein